MFNSTLKPHSRHHADNSRRSRVATPAALPPLIARYAQRTIADATRRGYAADVRHFLQHGGRLPATECMVALYLARHATKLRVATLQRRLAAIAWAHRQRRLRSPVGAPLVRATLHGIARARGMRQRQVAAIDKPLLQRMLAAAARQPRRAALRDRALILVGFAGAFRRAELVALDIADIRFTVAGAHVMLRRSKTDQMAAGRTVLLARTGSHYCPVRALQRWLRAARLTSGPVFRQLRVGDRVTENRLSAQSVALVVKRLVHATGIPPTDYSAHSLRAGYVTLAVQHGISTTAIRAQTGHKSDAVLLRYLRGAQPTPPALL